ncbi:hypothetical protein BJ165DRAFT_1352836 [Panaeolus papilionaceus]|nr:hypothetical protein BJ165DRAFT_1352836 [Panaeolus papilionaceus]
MYSICPPTRACSTKRTIYIFPRITYCSECCKLHSVCGVTGVGKTTVSQNETTQRFHSSRKLISCQQFIRSLTHALDVHTGYHHLDDDTIAVQTYEINILEGRTLVLVDTPGFDNPFRSDADTLWIISKYLEERYRQKKLLTGVIYFHRITDVRFDAGASVALKIFKKLYGAGGYDKLALVTTMWNYIQPEKMDEYREKESELKANAWSTFIDREHPALVARFDTSDDDMGRTSALNVVSGLLRNSTGGKLRLRIQRELVDEGKALHRTAAGMVAFTLQETARFYIRDKYLSVGPEQESGYS